MNTLQIVGAVIGAAGAIGAGAVYGHGNLDEQRPLLGLCIVVLCVGLLVFGVGRMTAAKAEK